MTRLRKTIMAVLILAGMLMPACTFIVTTHLDQELRSIVKPYIFNLWKHELGAVFDGLREIIRPGEKVKADDTATVKEYFMLVEQIKAIESTIAASDGDDEETEMLAEALARLERRRAEIEDKTRRILSEQIEQVLIDQGILNLLDNYLSVKVVFPPLIFELEEPPNLLVISPRDRIELDKRVLLSPGLEPEEKEAIESQVDGLDVSSLIVELGGFAGAWPAMVAEDNGLRYTINLVVEEWFHQYLAFRPLGFLYLLDSTGVREDIDIATMNETLAGMLAAEITSGVISIFYAGEETEDQFDQSGFDFDQQMRQLRGAVDEYLAQGKIEEAERFMEEERQLLAAEGYYIRKLNQAYFAFHGIYAYKPASVSPIDEDLRELRAQSGSLKEFLDDVAGMSGCDDLRRAVGD